MLFTSPHVLWLLPLALIAAWPGLRVGGRRRWGVFALRLILVALIVAALARLYVRSGGPTSVSVACIDLGPASADDADGRNNFLGDVRHRAGDVPIVAFSNRAAVLADATHADRLTAELAKPDVADDPAGGGSALAAALRLAATKVPAGVRGTIELWSAGLQTRGDAEAAAMTLARRGVAVRVTPAAVTLNGPAAIVRAVRLPGGVRVGQTVTAEVDVEARTAGAATLALTMTPGGSITQPVQLAAGAGRLSLPLTFRSEGVVDVDAKLNDGPARGTAVAVRPAASVIVVRDPKAGDTAGLNWAAMLGASANVTVVSPAVLAEATYDDAAAVVMDDVPADPLPTAAQERLRRNVSRGMGVLFVAGPASVPGDNAADPLASLWPVKLPRQAEQIEPSTALVLILDTSGSMQGEPLNLAKEVGRLAVSHLRPTDKVGIVEFFGGRRWAYPMQPVGDGAGVNRALARLTPGGASDLFPAVEEAGFALRNVAAQGKHVVILSDGFVAGGPFATRVRRMAGDGVTTSAVQIGQSDEGRLMASVALWGGGRFYSVPDRFALPDISFKQPRTTTRSPMVNRSSEVRAGNDPLTREDVSPWPEVNGYLRLTAQPTADVMLQTADGDPLLTRWRQGAGWAAALAIRPGAEASSRLSADPRFISIVATLARGSGAAAESLKIRPIVRPAGVEIDIAAVKQADASSLRLSVRNAAGEVVRETQCQPVAPGHWNVLVDGLPAGTYSLEAAGVAVRAVAAFRVDAPLAVPGVRPDQKLLDRIESFAKTAESAVMESPAGKWVDLRPLLVASAMVALVLNVAVRRWPGRNRL